MLYNTIYSLIFYSISIAFHCKESIFRNELNYLLKVFFINNICHCSDIGFIRDSIKQTDRI